jgi:nicotinamidase-related amidase
LLLGGISTDNCVSLTSFDAIRDGYRAVVVVDASATGNPLVEGVSLQRLGQAGATLTGWVQLGAEMLDNWATPEGEQLARVFQEHLSVSTLSPS